MTNEQKIKHLYWRAGFGLSPLQLKKKSHQSLDKVVEGLFKDAKKLRPVKLPYYNRPARDAMKNMSKKERKKIGKAMQQLTGDVNLNWVRQMVSDDSSPLQEKMTLFWHGHFACMSKRYDRAGQQINMIRQHALGNFRDLVLGISKDASMIGYLNNQQNKKNKPNENYARELMELFTIGRGNYTEQDIKESARAFTGWFADRYSNEFNFVERQHDFGEKTFMGKTGKWNGEDIVDIILEREETAHYIAQKVYRYFVNYKVNEMHVKVLADAFYKSNYNITTMMRALFSSTWFYDTNNIGCKIKSPIEFLVGMARTLNLTFGNARAVLYPQNALGQILFKPPNVAGWPGGQAWIDNSTLMLRMNFAAIIFKKIEMSIQLKDETEGEKGRFMKKLQIEGDMAGLVQVFKKDKSETLGQALCDYLLQNKFTVQNSFLEQMANKESTMEEKIRAYALGIMSLPEYQMC